MQTPPPIPSKQPPPIPVNSGQPKTTTTGAGCFLILLTIAATAGAAWLFPFKIYPRYLPPGVYPRIVLALPIVGCGVAVGIVVSWLYKLLGIPISKKVEGKASGGTN